MSRRHIRVVGAMVEKDRGQYLITQRRPTAVFPLMWEFPGGRVEEGETDEEALARELSEEMGISVHVGEEAMRIHHEYPKYDVDFRVFRCRLASDEANIRHVRVHDHRWVTLQEMSSYEFPPADQRSLERLLDLDH